MYRPAFIVALGLFVAAPVVHAADLTVTINGQPTSYTLESLSVDARGNVKVVASGGSGTPGNPVNPGPVDPAPVDPAPVDPAPGNPAPVDPVAPSPTACVSTGKLTCVNTALPARAQSRLPYRPAADQVFAFRIDTPAGGRYLSSVSATVQTGSRAAKLLVISETPGDVSTAGKPGACARQGNEVTTLNLAINRADVHPSLYCHLEAGKTYYVNAASTTRAGKATCSTASSCGFYFEGS